RRAQLREIHAGAGAAFEDDALAAVPVEDRVHGVFDRQDEAGAALRLRLDADVEPDRAVEAGLLMEKQMRELVGEDLGVRRRREVPLRDAPRADRLDDAPDQLTDARLALRRAERAAEVLRHDDVGRELRP